LKSYIKPSAVFITMALLTACNSESKNSGVSGENAVLVTAATLGEQTVLPASDYLSDEPYAAADQRNGMRQAQICKACHSLEEGGPNMIGPALFGIFGRGVGQMAAFDYSPVMRNANFVWTPKALDAWLAQPGKFLPGNRMSFPGVFGQQDRNDLIAYLLVATSDSE
jgi:cytochrome c